MLTVVVFRVLGDTNERFDGVITKIEININRLVLCIVRCCNGSIVQIICHEQPDWINKDMMHSISEKREGEILLKLNIVCFRGNRAEINLKGARIMPLTSKKRGNTLFVLLINSFTDNCLPFA